MIINIGSRNPSKIAAVKEALKLYLDFKKSKFVVVEVKSIISDQPITLHETIKGARYRAKKSFKNCEYSIGIESGIMKIPYSNTGYMDYTVSVIYDGKNYFMGISPAFEFPKVVINDILKKKTDSSTSFYNNKLTNHKYVGYSNGIIGILTKNRKTRTDYTKDAIIMAMIQVENKKLYI